MSFGNDLHDAVEFVAMVAQHRGLGPLLAFALVANAADLRRDHPDIAGGALRLEAFLCAVTRVIHRLLARGLAWRGLSNRFAFSSADRCEGVPAMAGMPLYLVLTGSPTGTVRVSTKFPVWLLKR
jgi:hypothetical protein